MLYNNPASIYNVVHNSSNFFLNFFNKLGLPTITSVSKPFEQWLRKQIAGASPDPDGFFLER